MTSTGHKETELGSTEQVKDDEYISRLTNRRELRSGI